MAVCRADAEQAALSKCIDSASPCSTEGAGESTATPSSKDSAAGGSTQGSAQGSPTGLPLVVEAWRARGRDFAAPDALPPEAQARAAELLASGRLFRYQGATDAADLEKAFAEYIGAPFAVGVNSGGCALFLAMRALGVKPGDRVLCSAYTLPPVPGAIAHCGAVPVFVDAADLVLDLEDLEAKAEAHPDAKVLLVSYMRGRVPDLDALVELCARRGLALLEDCAHTLGATWRGRHIGTLGAVGCWSLQTNKAINSGEGGILATADPEIAARVTLNSGSYGHYAQHGTTGRLVPRMQELFGDEPNFSMRLSNLAAAVALPQLQTLGAKVARWTAHEALLRAELARSPHVQCFPRHAAECPAESSLQFRCAGFTEAQVTVFVERARGHGIPLAWFGGPASGFTSSLRHWTYATAAGSSSCHAVQNLDTMLAELVDLPLYHTAQWADADFSVLGRLLCALLEEAAQGAP